MSFEPNCNTAYAAPWRSCVPSLKRTAKTAKRVADYAHLTLARLDTFARVQVLLPRVANAGVGISVIGEDQLGALAAHGNQLDT